MKHYVILDCEDSETWDPERYYTMHKPIMGKEHAEEAWSLLHIARGDKVPALSDPPQYDGIVITGSRHNVRDELPWMGPLCALIQDVSRNEKNANVRLYGGCFGAQIIAHALGGKWTAIQGVVSVLAQSVSVRSRIVLKRCGFCMNVTVIV